MVYSALLRIFIVSSVSTSLCFYVSLHQWFPTFFHMGNTCGWKKISQNTCGWKINCTEHKLDFFLMILLWNSNFKVNKSKINLAVEHLETSHGTRGTLSGWESLLYMYLSVSLSPPSISPKPNLTLNIACLFLFSCYVVFFLAYV